MSFYCTDADITPYLPADHGVTDFDPIIAAATAEVDGRLGGIYWPFADVAADPATPPMIQNLAARFGAWLALLQIGAANSEIDLSQAKELWIAADTGCAKLADGTFQIPPVRVTDEVMDTLGTDPLEDDEYKFDCAPCSVIPESVQIATFEFGEDFVIRYSKNHRGPILTRLDSTITAASTVSYEFTYIRHTEIDIPEPAGYGKIVRA